MFSLKQHHNYSFSDLNDLYPYERDIYIDMLHEYLKEQEKQQEAQNR